MKLVLGCDEGINHFHLLRDAVPNLTIVYAPDRERMLAEIADADVFYGPPSRELVLAAKHLKWIQTASAGVDAAVAIPELIESDVILTNTRSAHAPSLSEHVFALLLAQARRLPTMFEWQKAKHWGKPEANRTLRELYRSTIGIVGFGYIGRAVAQRARAFEMNVLAIDAEDVHGDPWVEQVWTPRHLPELLHQSDVVVVTAPLTPLTRDLFGPEEFAAMKPSAYFIHISRGGIVNEAALVDALERRLIAGASLDVFKDEPLPADSPLWTAPNLIITPYVAGDSDEKERRCVEILRENLIRFSANEPLHNMVDKHRGYLRHSERPLVRSIPIGLRPGRSVHLGFLVRSTPPG
jgi:phosphoglycerate dehydrogenase-like enzyme